MAREGNGQEEGARSTSHLLANSEKSISPLGFDQPDPLGQRSKREGETCRIQDPNQDEGHWLFRDPVRGRSQLAITSCRVRRIRRRQEVRGQHRKRPIIEFEFSLN